jgi:isopenicillin N synthase-like dioxygenase
MVLESLGVEKYLDEHIESTNYLLRVMKYKGPETTDTKLGLSAHTDKNIVTILCQNQVDGLEVKTKDGEWINVKPSPDTFIVMIGDSLLVTKYFSALITWNVQKNQSQTKIVSKKKKAKSIDRLMRTNNLINTKDLWLILQAWANGRLHSPYHRVMMTGNKARYSAGLFSIPRAGYVVKAPEELVDEEHPLLFKPFDHVQFLAFYYTEAGQRAESALTTYCGVTGVWKIWLYL